MNKFSRETLSDLGWVLLIAGIVRLFVWYWVISVPVPMLYDESMYLEFSQGAADVVSELFSGRAPSEVALARWYGGGIFPPLHSLVLAAGRLIPTDPLSAARLVNVCVSTLTAALAFILTLQMTGSRSIAYCGGLICALYPSFVAYSHYLWTEPVFILFLLLAAVWTIAMLDARNWKAAIGCAVVGGACAAAPYLVRNAGMPLLVALPLYAACVAYRRQGWKGLAICSVYVGMMLLTILPWRLWIRAHADDPQASFEVNQMNLYMGNNPLVHLELGAANPPETRPQVFQAARESDMTPTELALREMISHPGTTALRMLARARMLVSPDYWAVRHAVKVRYPPMRTLVLAAFALLFFVSYWLLSGLILRGLVEPVMTVHHRWLPILITVVLAAGPILMIARSRYHQPILAVLIPLAAVGLVRITTSLSRHRAVLATTAYVLFLVVSMSAIPVVFRWTLRPSSYYFDIQSFLTSKTAEEMVFTDLFIVGTGGPEPISERIAVQTDAGELGILSATPQVIVFQIKGTRPQWPFGFSLIDRKTGQAHDIKAVNRRHWQQFNPTAVDGIQVMWNGAF